MNRTNIFAALACALLIFSLLGCGTSNNLQTITLTISGQSQSGVFDLKGIGGTSQLKATGNYSSGKTQELTNVVTYKVIVDPINNTDAFGFLLASPPQTVALSPTGLLTAVDPADCSWEDVSPDPKTFSWFMTGDYQVTATFQGVTSQPVFVAVASSAGNSTFNGVVNNPTEQCGP